VRLAAAFITAVSVATLGAAAAAPDPRPATLLAVGDVASCSSVGDEATAALVRGQPGSVAILGDIVYERGTTEEF
jgi:hypothetical protein